MADFSSSGIWDGETGVMIDYENLPMSQDLIDKFEKWIFYYEINERFGWGTGFKNFNPRQSFVGFTDAFLSQKNLSKKFHKNLSLNYKANEFFDKNHFTHNQLSLFTLIVFGGMILLLPLLIKRYGRIIPFILISLFCHIIFSTYWEAVYLEHWLTTIVLVVLSGILILNFLGEKLSFLLRRFSQVPFYIYALILLLSIHSYNMIHHGIPYSSKMVMDLWGIPEDEREMKSLFSTTIYKYPDNPYSEE